jgi:hypothetical protein
MNICQQCRQPLEEWEAGTCEGCDPDDKAKTLGGDEMTTTRKNICQPADWWAAFEAQATTMGYTLSEWIGLNCQSFLPDDVRAGLSERPAANRPKKGQVE